MSWRRFDRVVIPVSRTEYDSTRAGFEGSIVSSHSMLFAKGEYDDLPRREVFEREVR